MDELIQLRAAIWKRLLLCSIVVTAALILAMMAPEGHLRIKGVGILLILVVGAAITAAVTSEYQERYRALYKKHFLLQPLQKTFTDLQYAPDKGIPFQTIAETGMIAMGTLFHSEDYIQGRYQKLRFEQSDILMEERHYAQGSCSYSSSFIGRWMIVDFNKEFRANIQIVQKGFPGSTQSPGVAGFPFPFQKVSTESETFNRDFRVYAQIEHEAFYIITPALMERIQKLAARIKGSMMLCFTGQRLHIAIQEGKNSFEPPSIFQNFDVQGAMWNAWDEIRVITDVIDALNLNTDLFKPEE